MYRIVGAQRFVNGEVSNATPSIELSCFQGIEHRTKELHYFLHTIFLLGYITGPGPLWVLRLRSTFFTHHIELWSNQGQQCTMVQRTLHWTQCHIAQDF